MRTKSTAPLKSIDRNKFDAILLKKGISKTGVGRMLGKGDSYISGWTRQGCMPENIIQSLDEFIGIKYEDIRPDYEAEPRAEKKPKVKQMSFIETNSDMRELIDLMKSIDKKLDVIIAKGDKDAKELPC